MTKSLLLKGLAGVAAVGGVATGGIVAVNSNLFGGGGAALTEPKSEDVSNLSDKEFIDKAGLNCGLSDDALAESDSKDCSVKEGSTLRVMVGNQTEEGVTFDTSSSGSAKLKVSRSKKVGDKEGTELYTKELKFVVDSGDITLAKEGGSPAITKLGQFETYEIFKDKDKFYLRRKTEAKVGKKNALGLGDCEFPDKDRDCSYDTEDKIKKIRFESQTDGITISSGTVTLKVSKMGDSDSDFGDEKYRFTFTFPSDVTINSKELKANIPYDFKIKKGSGNSLTLEQAWSEDSAFTKKAGLSCDGSNNECSVPADSQTLNVKVGKQTKEGITSLTGSGGKIKMEKDQAGYNQGLKFTITTADISLTSGTPSGTDIEKLEELETYEITEEGGKYYLTRKTTREEGIKSSLVLPKDCQLPSSGSVNCTLDDEKFKGINFSGKDTATSGSGTLTISKTSSADFPLGYKFTFKTETEATVSSSNKIKANIPTDFKIKKGTDGSPISLEKAWSETKFAEKVGLTCTSGTDICCSQTTGGSVKLNVKKGTDVKTDIESVSTSETAKIKVEKDQAGYNQGLKFTISGGDVSLTGGTAKAGSGNIDKLEELETYEITEEGDKYYLTRKTEAIKTIESQLGLTDAGCSLSTSCTLTSDKLQKINFSEKEAGKPTISSGTASLTITKTDNKTDFPLGYKFTLQSQQEITIKTDNKVAANTNTEFKIKKGENGASLTLEKAWTAESLGNKVGLQNCSTNNSSEGCSIQEGQLKVKQQNKHSTDVKGTNLKKKSSSSGCGIAGKIKVTKDQAGYNQGFKFEITDGNIELDGSTGSDDDSKIHSLGEFETYEIKEDEGDKQWYLVRKDRADGYIKKELKLDGVCSEYEKFPHGTSGSTTCDFKKLDDLKKVKFAGDGSENNISGTVNDDSDQVQLQIKKDTKLPGGFKFTFSGGKNVCLPDGAGGKVSLGESSNAEYKIKKCSKGNTISLTLEKNNGGGGTCPK